MREALTGQPEGWPRSQLLGFAASRCRSVVADNRSSFNPTLDDVGSLETTRYTRYAGRDVPFTPPDQAPTLDAVLDCLNALPARATYNAVAELIGSNPQAVLHRLGSCRPEASWVVNAESGLPTGYQVRQLDTRLPGSRIIRTADELRRRLFDLPPKRTPGVRLLPLQPKS